MRPSAYSSVDRVQMKRAVMNIINNCVKYKKPGVCTIRITLRMEESDIRIEIADNGMGVSEEDLTKIFDSFYRTDRARTNVRSGSGLGLAITKQIIDRHSGKIWASGSIGKGPDHLHPTACCEPRTEAIASAAFGRMDAQKGRTIWQNLF